MSAATRSARVPRHRRRGRFGRQAFGLAAVAAGCAAVLTACEPAPPPAPPQPTDTTPAGAAAARTRPFVVAAESLVAFLAGRAALDTTMLADSVTLLVAPEGGTGRRTLARREAADRTAWRIGERSLLPPLANAELVSRYGRHLNCLEYPLASRSDSLARRPHVGTMLRPAALESCLQTWNMTFVFAADSTRAQLTHVLYDQWEW